MLKEFDGYYVVRLVDCDGVPKYSNTGLYEGQMRLDGEKFEIAGEPIFISNDEVLVDAIEMRSGTLKRMRIPLPALKMAHEKAA